MTTCLMSSHSGNEINTVSVTNFSCVDNYFNDWIEGLVGKIH